MSLRMTTSAAARNREKSTTDWREIRYVRHGGLGQVAAAIDHGDHLHYVVHLAIGRAADLTPWTRKLADDQYLRAAQHVRTGRQEALVTTERPTTLKARVLDALGILDSGIHWGDIAANWAVRHVLSMRWVER